MANVSGKPSNTPSKEGGKKGSDEKTLKANLGGKEVKWITVHGLHVPLGVGEAEEDVIKRMIEKQERKRSAEKLKKQAKEDATDKQYREIEERQAEKDRLNEEMNSLWAKAPLLDKKGEFTKADLQRILNYLKKNPTVRDKFIKSLPNTANGRAIASVVRDGNASSFNKHGVEVIEAFSKSYKGFK